jgi:uncharacterized protein (DUF427 family)
VSLTVGRGPFGHQPAGAFNFEPPKSVVYTEPFPRRVRAVVGGEAVADSLRAQLLSETGRLPVIYMPEEDVRLDHIPADALSRHERLPGHVAVAWTFPEAWFDEDEEMHGHVRDPYHRIDIRQSSRHVIVRVGGQAVAESRTPLILFETGLPPRYYFDRAEVRLERLEPHGCRTRCAYKGLASHWSVRTEEGLEEAIGWTYPEPDPEVGRIGGRIAFYNERVELEVDGRAMEPPVTPWAEPGWWRGRERAR